MKILKRILCLTLVVLMLLPLLVACGNDKDKNKGSNNNGDKGGVDQSLLEAEMPDDGVGMQDFGGKTFRLLGFNAASANEFEVDAEDTGTTLKAAVYARNEALKGRLKCDLKWDYIAGHAGYEAQFVNEAGLRAGSGQVQIFTPYSQAGSWLMQNGILQDLKKVKYLDFTDPWWNPSFLSECTVNDRLYFASGDISWTMMGNTIGFCFNKDILSQKSQVLEQFGVTSMYELVQQGKWTIDNFITISRAVAAKNTYGFTAYIVPMDAFFKGVGLNWMEVNANGQQEMSDDISSGRTNTVLGKLSPFFRTDAAAVRLGYDVNLDYATNNGNKSNPSNPEWQKGQSLFVLNAMLSITDFRFTELGFDFGVLPMPMYDETQYDINDKALGYRTIPDFEYSIICVPRQVKGVTLDQVGAVLQVMASEGQARIATPYFEEVMKKQEADSADDYTMWETIKNSTVLEGGRLFTALGGEDNDGFSFIMFRRSLQLKKNTVNEQWDGGAQKAKDLVANLNVEMAKIEAKYQ